MLRKPYLLFLILLPLQLFSQSFEINVKPVVGNFMPTSKQLSGYYAKDNIFTYGGEINLLTDFYDLGFFVTYQKYSVDINDANQIGGSWNETSTMLSFGAIKRFKTDWMNIDLKAGLSTHNDNLAFGEDNSRLGYRVGVEFVKQIYNPIQISLGIDYDHETLSVPQYYTFTYLRHNAFFSGQEFSTGGFIIHAGLAFNFSL